MGLFVPDITKPIRLQVSADDVKREALGRTMSILGMSVGVLGGLMVLSANPAIAAAAKQKTGVSLTMSVASAKRDALGKVLAVIGSAVGAGGTVLVMSANPKMKAQFGSTWDRLPAGLRGNKQLVTGAFIGLVVLGAAYLVRSQKNAIEDTMKTA
jgi:hypothetical protein